MTTLFDIEDIEVICLHARVALAEIGIALIDEKSYRSKSDRTDDYFRYWKLLKAIEATKSYNYNKVGFQTLVQILRSALNINNIPS